LTTLLAGSALAGCYSDPEDPEPSAYDTTAPSTPEPRVIQPPTSQATLPPTPTGADSAYAPPPDFRPKTLPPPPSEKIYAANLTAVIPRSAWTTAKPVKPCLPMGGVALLTFHHDGDPVGFADTSFAQTAQYLERIRAYHAKTGFEDIAYHYAIDRAGRVWELRSVALRGEHVRPGYDQNHVLHKWNDHNVGVVVLGNFMQQTPSDAQKQRIISFGAQLRKRYRLTIAQVKVHQELVTTECPGVHLRPYMDQVRQRGLI
jgi:hypothetical protein